MELTLVLNFLPPILEQKFLLIDFLLSYSLILLVKYTSKHMLRGLEIMHRFFHNHFTGVISYIFLKHRNHWWKNHI